LIFTGFDDNAEAVEKVPYPHLFFYIFYPQNSICP